MSRLDRLSAIAEETGASLASILKIILYSRRATVRHAASAAESIVILGNGPSLNQTVQESAEFLAAHKKLAVNFAANTPLYRELKPDFYVLADPHFFYGENDNVDKLWQAFRGSTDWTMTLFVPTRIKSRRIDSLKSNPHITVARYNTVPIEGFQWLRHFAYRAGLGMPRPRNVLIPSIMLALNSGFKTVYIAGADHSWMKTISVNDQNQVISVQPHFYKDNEKETVRVNTEYTNYPLHQIIHSFYTAFRSYHKIRAYADSLQAAVWNITPGSFIDAFPRKKV